MPHNPRDPETKAAYQALIKEAGDQYQSMLDAGLKVDFIYGKDPYGNPRNAILDVTHNNHLSVFPTTEGFGSGSPVDVAGNPLLAPTRFKIGDKVMLANDVFRAVHDYYGHIANGVGFRADGEENAWRSHMAMYSPLARRAMTTETRGQNSWVNYGPHAEANRAANGADTVFAPQKIGLLPDWVTNEGRNDDSVGNHAIKDEINENAYSVRDNEAESLHGSVLHGAEPGGDHSANGGESHYGEPQDGSTSVRGIHFSGQPRD